jgi:Large polyvalent protein-associated domain 7
MLVRISGGRSGIADYLENGQKQGREQSREELDERVILDGDLELTDAFINSMDKRGDRYLHITLAFKEDEVSPETLQAITQDFKQFAMTAFEADEFNFYAEAHLPRIKSVTHRKTGALVERKPHIHIVIPQQNLLSGRNLNPFGRVEQQTAFIDAFQEFTNAKYGLASPKDNRRIEFTDASEMISRYKGDVFEGQGRALKERVLSDLLDQDIRDYERFKTLLSGYGQIRVRNEGGIREYLNVKPEDAAKGINLKDYVFSRDFIEKTPDEKRVFLMQASPPDLSNYEVAESGKPPEDRYRELLAEWHDVRAREIKYLNSGHRKGYQAYKEADPEQRKEMLKDLAERFYRKHRQGLEADLERAKEAQGEREPVQEKDKEPTERNQRSQDNVVGQLKAEQEAQSQAEKAARTEEFKTLKRELEANRLLDHLSQTHGVIPDKYTITKGKDGGDRIRAGTRNLNVADFLTQEMRMSFKEAAPILRTVYAEQKGLEKIEPRRKPDKALWEAFKAYDQEQQKQRKLDWAIQRENEKQHRATIRENYLTERRKLKEDWYPFAGERKAALSLARMERVAKDMTLNETIQVERQALKDRYGKPYQTRYEAFVLNEAARGDASALDTLHRQRQNDPHRPAVNSFRSQKPEAKAAQAETKETAALFRNLTHETDWEGTVTYFADKTKKKALVVDRAEQVQVEDSKNKKAVEIGLRLAVQKFGTDLKVEGTEEFKKQTVMAALKMGLQVTFDDPRMNAELERLRGERQENRERGKAVTGRWVKEKTSEKRQEKELEIKPPQPEKKSSRDYER